PDRMFHAMTEPSFAPANRGPAGTRVRVGGAGITRRARERRGFSMAREPRNSAPSRAPERRGVGRRGPRRLADRTLVPPLFELGAELGPEQQDERGDIRPQHEQ